VRSSAPLLERYDRQALDAFTVAERAHFAAGDVITEDTAWQLLYRLEPDLYERLTAGERIHPDVLAWLPEHVERCVEIAAGTGRLTTSIAPRCDELVLVEPAAPMRDRLRRRFPDADVRDGFFDELPVEDGWADLVISCSAFRADDAGLAEMERVAKRPSPERDGGATSPERDGGATNGMIALVWPADLDWVLANGFEYVSFDGEMSIEFASPDEAVELARIFYPHAADAIAARGSATVPYDVIGMNPPRDVAHKRV
jgi:hypothetical protein